MLTRNELPADSWQYRYQIGFLVAEAYLFGRVRQLIVWRTVPQNKFIAKYYRGPVSANSHPQDALAVFHSGDVQRFGRRVFRALKS